MAEIDRLLAFLKEQRGSDLHISAHSPPIVRVHGVITPLKMAPLEPAVTERLVKEIMPPLNREEYERDSDTDFSYDLPAIDARFRVNVFRDLHGVGGVLRLIPNEIMTAEELGLPPAAKRFCSLPKGLVLITGPTGCGKSTTQAAMLDIVNKTRREHIVTIEDPIEFVHQGKQCLVNQREVHSHTTSFARALRAALREDPDVVLVGEMRDLETTHIAIETAETGHLVLATLHTTTAARTVNRLIDQFPADLQEQIRSMLAGSLAGVISQNLIRRKGGKGRVAVYEVLVCTPAAENCIRENKLHQIPSIMQTGAKYGMMCMNDSLLKLVMQGIVTPEAALAKTFEREDFAKKLAVAGIDVRGTGEQT